MTRDNVRMLGRIEDVTRQSMPATSQRPRVQARSHSMWHRLWKFLGVLPADMGKTIKPPIQQFLADRPTWLAGTHNAHAHMHGSTASIHYTCTYLAALISGEVA